MADQVADELARGVRLGGEEPANPKRRRTIPLHDPFFVGTPEEEQRHSQRLLASTRKRKSDDYADLDDAVGGAQAAAELMAAGQRLSKGPRRSKAQASVVDIDTLNRKLSSFALTDEDQNSSCRALVLYSRNPILRPTITTVEEPDDAPEMEPIFPLRSYRDNQLPSFTREDQSKAIIIYPEEHPLKEVMDKIKDYERRTGRSTVKIEELSTSIDDIDDDTDHSLHMFEDNTSTSSAISDDENDTSNNPYVVEADEDADGDDERECESIDDINKEVRIEEIDDEKINFGAFEDQAIHLEELTGDAFVPFTTATTTASTATSTSTFPSSSPSSHFGAGLSSFASSSPCCSSTQPLFSGNSPPLFGSSPSSFLVSPPILSSGSPFTSYNPSSSSFSSAPTTFTPSY